MPQYQFLTRISTYFVPVPKNRLFLSRISDRLEKRLASEKLRLQGASKARLSPLATFLKKKATQHQLVSCWTEDDLINLSRAGLSIEDFQVIMDGARIVACSALWDQRAFKQTVIRSYRGKARVLRPWWNWASCILGMPGLPSEGCAVAFACLSPLMMEETDEHLFFALLESSLLNAARRNLEYIVLSLPEDSRWSALRQKIRGWKYKTKLYRVCWEEEKNNQIVLDGRPVLPELAFL